MKQWTMILVMAVGVLVSGRAAASTWHFGMPGMPQTRNTEFMYAIQSSTAGWGYTGIAAKITVPAVPPSGNDQGVAYWIGVESSDGGWSWLVQPVLAFGTHWQGHDPSLNGRWYIEAYAITASTNGFPGNAVGVNPGDVILLSVYADRIDQRGVNWHILAWDTTTGGESQLAFLVPEGQNSVVMAQEFVHVGACADTPSATLSQISSYEQANDGTLHDRSLWWYPAFQPTFYWTAPFSVPCSYGIGGAQYTPGSNEGYVVFQQ